MERCYQALPQKEHFICDDANYVKEVLTTRGFAVVACVDHRIAGYLLITTPGYREENLGYDVLEYLSRNTTGHCPDSLPSSSVSDDKFSSALPASYSSFSRCDLNKVVHMDSSCVLPDYRGHHLESRMISFAETLIDTTKYHYAFATVAPDNTASLKSLKKCHYHLLTTKEKYGGYLRCIMMKSLKS